MVEIQVDLLAKNVRTTKLFRQGVQTLKSIAGKPAPTGFVGIRKIHEHPKSL
jgi:hypothetical protein